MTAVKEGTISSDQHIIDDSGSLGDASNSKMTCSNEESSAVYYGNVNMPSIERDCDGCNDTHVCNSGCCVACLSGNYPIALDW